MVYTLQPASVDERQICVDGALEPSGPGEETVPATRLRATRGGPGCIGGQGGAETKEGKALEMRVVPK